MILDMIEDGHSANLVLSHDNTALRIGMTGMDHSARGNPHIRDVDPASALPPGQRDSFLPMHERILPRLRAAKIADDFLEQLVVGNPRRLLTIRPTQEVQ